jgi:hypothetical protein
MHIRIPEGLAIRTIEPTKKACLCSVLSRHIAGMSTNLCEDSARVKFVCKQTKVAWWWEAENTGIRSQPSHWLKTSS